MARTHNGTSDTMTHADASALRPAFPITLGLWYKASTGPGNFKYIVSKVALAGDHPSFAFSTNGSGEIRFIVGYGTNAGEFSTTSGVGTAFTYDGIWHHYAGIYDGANVQIWFDGQLIAAQAETRALAYAALPLWVGSFDGSVLFASGDYAELTLWNTALTSDDLVSVVAGISSKLVRPDKLQAYWPLVGGNSPETDEVSALDLTLTGTTASAHPRIFRPTSTGARRLATTGAAGTNAPAGSTAVTVTAGDATATVAPSAESTAVTVAANSPTATVAPSAGSTAVTVAAGDATATVVPSAESTGVAVAAVDAMAAVAPSAGTSGVTVAAGDVTATVSVSAGLASVAVAANDPPFTSVAPDEDMYVGPPQIAWRSRNVATAWRIGRPQQ